MIPKTALLVLPLLLAGAALPSMAMDDTPPGASACEDGYRIVEEVCYRTVVVRSHCRMVPDVKTVKKYVYTMKEVPICLTNCPNPLRCRGGDCEPCLKCASHPRCRRVLVKHEVIEKVPGFKCVVECETEEVPYTVQHKVPCAGN